MINRSKKQFIMWHMSINTIIILVCFFVIYFVTLSSIQVRNNERLNLISADYASSMATFEKSIFESNDYSIFFSVTLDEQNLVTSVRSPIDLKPNTISEAIKLYLEKEKIKGDINFSGKHWVYTTTAQFSITANQVREILFLDVTESFNLLQNLLIIFFVVGLSVVIVNFFISVLFARRVVRPISESFEKQKRFVADASHELKTPLAVMTSNVEALISETNLPEVNHWTHNILMQIERMDMLVKNLLFLAKADEKIAITEFSQVNISKILDEVLTEMEVPIYEKNLHLEVNIIPNIIIQSNAFDIKQVIVILLDNAIKYTNDNGKIIVSLEKTKAHVSVIIENTCNGIPKEHLPHIFDRFYRTNESRNHDGSFGLGLSIAKAIMVKVGGNICVNSTDNKSVSFSLIFKNI